jgi:hypothetical protein
VVNVRFWNLVVRVSHHYDFFHTPYMVVDLRFHSWRDAQSLVNFAAVIEHEVQTDRMHVIH